MYRLRVRGLRICPQTGGALLVANHVSWLDGVLLLSCRTRPIRMLAWSDYVSGWWINWLAQDVERDSHPRTPTVPRP